MEEVERKVAKSTLGIRWTELFYSGAAGFRMKGEQEGKWKWLLQKTLLRTDPRFFVQSSGLLPGQNVHHRRLDSFWGWKVGVVKGANKLSEQKNKSKEGGEKARLMSNPSPTRHLH